MRTPTRTIPDDVADVLRRSRCTDNLLYLPAGQLDRRLYTATNDVLASLGGAWKSGKVKAHVFPAGTDAETLIDDVLNAGAYTKPSDLAFFPTPSALVERMVRLAGVTAGQRVLEPSAGTGAIARQLRGAGAIVQCVEFDEKRAATLRDDKFDTIGADFLTVDPSLFPPFDAVVMNPPFALEGHPQADIEHITHAARFVARGGIVVAIMSGGVLYRSNARAVAFRALVESRGGTIEALPDDTFKSAGTSVRTALVTFRPNV